VTKAQAQLDHTKAYREVRKSIQMHKRNYIDCLAEEGERAPGSGNMRQLYDTTRKPAGKHSKPERPVKEKQGRNTTGTEKQLNRWAEHFEELLNRPATLHLSRHTTSNSESTCQM